MSRSAFPPCRAAIRPRRPLRAFCLLGVSLAVLAPSAALADASVIGRVRLTPIPADPTGVATAARDAYAARVASERLPSGLPAVRILSFRPRPAPGLYDVTVFDYRVETGFEIVVDAAGKERDRRLFAGQPPLDPAELADAMQVVRRDPRWAASIDGLIREPYAPMPPVTVDAAGRRLVNVGLLQPGGPGGTMLDNEVVSVDLPTGEIVRWPAGAPASSRAPDAVCGTPAAGCPLTPASCASNYHVDWPAEAPLWSFDVMHPACTASVQPDGTGIELRNVVYDGHLLLERAHIPVLNVRYDADACGPYRDWLTSENCFQADGTDAAPGFRVTDTSSPATFCESGSDAGNFLGVAFHDEGESLWIVTENEAGWYRYVMQWRLHRDGTIEPIMGFGGTRNACICNVHNHHAYWRFEWALDGTAGNPATGITTLERRHPGTTSQWDPIATEGSFIRPTTNGSSDWWRVKNPATGTNVLIEPGPIDGSAQGDSYAKADFWALARNDGEIDDPNPDTSIAVSSWLNGEALGASKRLVTWYAASYRHDVSVPDPEPCEFVGPRIVFRSCSAILTFDRSIYGCSGTVGLTMTDDDLSGAGTASLVLSSPTEPAGETVALVENPSDPGSFTGTVTLVQGAHVVAGDGRLSVVHGDTITARYLDATHCGAQNVTVEKGVEVDCRPPRISGVHVEGITNGAGTVAWATDEPATSVVHYGASMPGTATATTAGLATAHAVSLSSLPECAAEAFRVESTDAAGNVAVDDAGGPGYGFTTARLTTLSFASGGSVAIPDNTTAMASSAIAVAEHYPVRDANAAVTVTHPNDSDLSLWLVAPNGTAVSLADARGGTGDNFTGTVFDDEAATAIGSGSAPFAGSFRPEQPLSAMDGFDTAGSWKVEALDQATGNTGTLNSWSLQLTRPEYACAAHVRTDARLTLSDSCATGGPGSGNGMWDPGDVVTFDVTLVNDGTTPVTGVSAVVTATTPGAVMTQATAAYPDIAPGASADSQGTHFAVRVPTSLACGGGLAFRITVSASQGSWTESLVQTVGTPQLTTTVVLSENFNSGTPPGWTVVNGGFGGGVADTWTTTNPGLRASAPPIAPPFAIVDSRKAGGSAFQDEQLVTSTMDLTAASAVTLEFDHYFRWFSGGTAEVGSVDVKSNRTYNAWQTARSFAGGSGPISDHQTVDITPFAAGAPNVQVRFHYTGANDWYWQLDNVKVTALNPAGCVQSACSAPAAGPPPVPDGITGLPLLATRAGLGGGAVDLSWDAARCVAAGYHLLYGPLAGVSSYAVTGAACGLGTSGAARWTGVPAGDLWFVVVGENGAGTEGSWGTSSSGAERAGTTPSGQCGCTVHTNGATCP